MNLFGQYARWLHTKWPAGRVEKLPAVDDDGQTNVRGLYIAGDLRGIPLLKFAADSGARVIRKIAGELGGETVSDRDGGAVDVAIVGAGVAGMTAALEARKLGLTFRVFEANELFSTIVNFPKGKPIYTYPKGMTPAGDLRLSADVKEELLEELYGQTVTAGQVDESAISIELHGVHRVRKRGEYFELSLAGEAVPATARRVVVAIGRSGNFRRLGVPGEDLDKVYNRLHDPNDFSGKKALVIGGGDSALESAVALAQCGAEVTLSYRQAAFNRPKVENVETVSDFDRRGKIRLIMSSSLERISKDEVVLKSTGTGEEKFKNDVVFTMIGREQPLDFFRRSGVAITGEWNNRKLAAFAGFLVFCALLYNWKSGGQLSDVFYRYNWWPISIKDAFAAQVQHPGSLIRVMAMSASTPSFWYTLAYSVLVVLFGVRRIKRHKTPYITVQTSVLMTIQVLPLFLLPELLLPWLGNNGWLPQGFLDTLFPVVDYGHGREYWRAYGFILAWPLNVYNVFTDNPLGWWLAIASVQTFVAIPAAVYLWGKGAYCGWVCSCGALAETLGDGQRTKMPHGPIWNRLNLSGQVVLLIAVVLLVMRIVGWAQPPGTGINKFFHAALNSYKWVVDVFLAGIVGYGFYFWFSGRVWCRFVCPLAALMHVYARFSRFGILADKKKCISCNVCTAVCHQGIDVMSFANKGIAMRDPQCVRCSACVQNCPTGVLEFGRLDGNGNVIATDSLAASPVRIREN